MWCNPICRTSNWWTCLHCQVTTTATIFFLFWIYLSLFDQLIQHVKFPIRSALQHWKDSLPIKLNASFEKNALLQSSKHNTGEGGGGVYPKPAMALVIIPPVASWGEVGAQTIPSTNKSHSSFIHLQEKLFPARCAVCPSIHRGINSPINSLSTNNK